MRVNDDCCSRAIGRAGVHRGLAIEVGVQWIESAAYRLAAPHAQENMQTGTATEREAWWHNFERRTEIELVMLDRRRH